MDCSEVMVLTKQLALEVDHSAGHAKFCDDGLHVGHMNVEYGG